MIKKPQMTKGNTGVEYIVLMAIIIVMLIVFLAPNGTFQTAFNKITTSATSEMTNMGNRIALSRGNTTA